MFLQVIDLNFVRQFDQLSKKQTIFKYNNMLARGPNLLNLANYTKQQGEEVSSDANEVAEMVEDEGINIQQQFDAYIKDIQKYDEILTKVAKSVNEASAEEYFITDFYPEFAVNCMYENDQQKRIIAHHDIQLGRVIENLERNNRNLKSEFKGWLFQYAKKTRLSQVLITENKLLRKYISAKNKDIVKLINGITNAENQQLNQLNQNLNELRQENGVLMDHLKEVKQTLVDKADQEKKLVEAYQKAEKQKLQIQSKIKQGEDQEQHYSKMVTLLEASLEDATQREKKLLQQKQRLTKIKQEFQEDQAQIEKEIDACKMDRENIDKNLKAKFKGHQSQKQKLMDQIEELTQKIKRVKEQSRNLEEEISRHEFKIQEYTTICGDLDKKSTEMSENLKKSEEEHKKLKQVEIQQLSSMDMINFDIELIQQEIKQLDDLEQQNRDKYKKQIRDLENEKKQELAKITEEYSKVQWKANQAITQKRTDIGLKKKEIQNLQSSIMRKKQQIEELKQQLAQVKQNQATFSNLKLKLRDAEKK